MFGILLLVLHLLMGGPVLDVNSASPSLIRRQMCLGRDNDSTIFICCRLVRRRRRRRLGGRRRRREEYEQEECVAGGGDIEKGKAFLDSITSTPFFFNDLNPPKQSGFLGTCEVKHGADFTGEPRRRREWSRQASYSVEKRIPLFVFVLVARTSLRLHRRGDREP